MPSISSLLIFLVPLTESQIHIDYLAVSSTVSPSLLLWCWNFTYGPQQPASTWMLEIQTQILPCVCVPSTIAYPSPAPRYILSAFRAGMWEFWQILILFFFFFFFCQNIKQRERERSALNLSSKQVHLSQESRNKSICDRRRLERLPGDPIRDQTPGIYPVSRVRMSFPFLITIMTSFLELKYKI